MSTCFLSVNHCHLQSIIVHFMIICLFQTTLSTLFSTPVPISVNHSEPLFTSVNHIQLLTINVHTLQSITVHSLSATVLVTSVNHYSFIDHYKCQPRGCGICILFSSWSFWFNFEVFLIWKCVIGMLSNFMMPFFITFAAVSSLYMWKFKCLIQFGGICGLEYLFFLSLICITHLFI